MGHGTSEGGGGIPTTGGAFCQMHLCSPICQAFICILLPARSPLLFAIVTRSIVLWKEGRRLRKKECLVGLQMKTTIHQCLIL